MKKIIDLKLEVDASYDADIVGHIIAEQAKQCNTDKQFVNLVKVQFDQLIPAETIMHYLTALKERFEEQGVDNAIFVGLDMHISDITIEEVRVTYECDEGSSKETD